MRWEIYIKFFRDDLILIEVWCGGYILPFFFLSSSQLYVTWFWNFVRNLSFSQMTYFTTFLSLTWFFFFFLSDIFMSLLSRLFPWVNCWVEGWVWLVVLIKSIAVYLWWKWNEKGGFLPLGRVTSIDCLYNNNLQLFLFSPSNI